jgi:hypothetical protein
VVDVPTVHLDACPARHNLARLSALLVTLPVAFTFLGTIAAIQLLTPSLMVLDHALVVLLQFLAAFSVFMM